MPLFGWGATKYNLWWIVISTIVLVGGICNALFGVPSLPTKSPN
jgi:hypothetical protein